MSQKAIAVIAGVVIVVVAGVLVLVNKDSNQTTDAPVTGDVQTGEQAAAGATKTACEIFTQDIAQDVLGSGAQPSELPDTANASTDDVSVSNCVYQIESGEALETANVLVRGGKTQTGRESNDFGFHNPQDVDGNSLDTIAISDLGDEAYWSPDFGQVNVYVGGGQYWLIVQYGNQGTNEQRAKAERLAQLVVANL